MATKRDYRLDNLRCVLIFLVVFCHLMVEVAGGPLTGTLYQIIYVFHMPAFVLVTGYFARFRPRKIAAGMLAPYIVFQLAASIRRNIVAGRLWYAGLTLLEPQWTLWYLLACVIWYLTVPALERIRTPRARVATVLGSFVVSVAVGFVPWIGEFFDTSRMVVLYPFFCSGFFLGKIRVSEQLSALDAAQTKRLRLAGVAAVVLTMAVHFAHGRCPAHILFRDQPYASVWDAQARAIIQVAAAAWCVLLFVWAPKRELGMVSQVGRNTMSVYLLHPWLMRALRHVLPLPGGEIAHVAACAVLSVGMLLVLGNDRVGGSFRWIFSPHGHRKHQKA